jgi:hypothetical protein
MASEKVDFDARFDATVANLDVGKLSASLAELRAKEARDDALQAAQEQSDRADAAEAALETAKLQAQLRDTVVEESNRLDALGELLSSRLSIETREIQNAPQDALGFLMAWRDADQRLRDLAGADALAHSV